MQHWLWTLPPDVYPAALRAGTLALRRQGRARLAEVRPGDRIVVYLSGAGVLAGAFEAVGEAFEDATALAPGRHLPHRLRVRPLAVLPPEARVARSSFAEDLRVLREYPDVPPEGRFRRVAQQVLHPLPRIDGVVLEFVLRARLGADPEALLAAVEAVREARDAVRDVSSVTEAEGPSPSAATVAEVGPSYEPLAAFDRAGAMETLVSAIRARGFRYAPWEVAAYATALRTKPFVLLAGVTGVGKTQLPVLVAEATGGQVAVLPVRPDWTDPAETMGFTDLSGRFRPGAVLRIARDAASDPGTFRTLVLDEMNLGRPEHYLAEVLSRMEQRAPADGGPVSPPLLTDGAAPAEWQAVRLPPTLGIVGTVNVDESAYAFSRKVLDRAFVLELAPRDLAVWETASSTSSPVAWPVEAWMPRALRLGGLHDLEPEEESVVQRAVAAVAAASEVVAGSGHGPGYRTRDEVALFALHAAATPGAFRTDGGEPADPLDVALLAKLLPRLDGARVADRVAAAALLGWAIDGAAVDLRDAQRVVDDWVDAGRPRALPDAAFPRTAARLARIVEGALDDGVASFWA